MEGVFFAVNPVWWIVPIHLTSLIIATVGGMIVGIFLWYREQIRSKPKTIQPYEFRLVNPEDMNYSEKTLAEIRRYLTYQYIPIHSWAHIPDDIAIYSTDTRLIEIIRELEQIEYSGNVLQIYQKESINRELISKLLP